MHPVITAPSSDLAVFEYVDGKLVIHRGKQYKVVTKSPTYYKQLAIMEYWKNAGGWTNTYPAPPAPPIASFGRSSYSTQFRGKWRKVHQRRGTAKAPIPGDDGCLVVDAQRRNPSEFFQ
jgi:penicillin V acylase-like amidase (Ntn superfamily)